jgi:PAS domain S-box-containing protein
LFNPSNAEIRNMNTTTSKIQRWQQSVYKIGVAAIGAVLGVWAGAEPQQRRRLRLFTAFMILMAFNALLNTLVTRNFGGNTWMVTLSASIFFFIGYIISRSRYHRVAIIVAITIPLISPLATIIFQFRQINLMGDLMWLALPMLVASLMLSAKKTTYVVFFYITFIILLACFGSLGFQMLPPLIIYLLIIAFFIVTITAVHEKNQAEIENQLKKLQQKEKALRESEDKFRNLFEHAKDAIFLADTETGIILDVNTAGCSLLGLPKKKIIGKHQSEVHPPELVKKYNKLFQKHIQKGIVISDGIIVQRADGTKIPVDISASVVKLRGKTILQGIYHDITERKRAEEKLKLTLTSLEHSTAQLQATNKELESFGYSVSHDLRSPLRSIDGFSQALLEDYANTLDEKGKDYFKRLRGASQKMGELIDGLLKLSRVTRSEMHQEKIDLSTLAKDIIGRLKETDPKRHVKVTIGDDLVTNGDSQMMRVLLENLLGNAWKFTAKTQHARIELGRGVNGDKNTFFIKDNGAGFDMAFKDKLFGAFQRLHDNTEFPGTGIGLATVQRIINRHGGSIRAEAEVGKGATFYFTFNEGA